MKNNLQTLLLPLSLIVLIILIIAIGSDAPLQVLRDFFIGPWASVWSFGNTLDKAALILTASLGAAFAFQAGCFNIGGEGQIYIGGLAAAVAVQGKGLLLGGACAAILAGGLCGWISGILKKSVGANELITSFLLSASLTPVADYLITGPLRDRSGNLLATPPLPRTLLRILPPSNLSVSFFFAVILVLLGYIFVSRTVFGYQFRIAGSAPSFARYGGIEIERTWAPAMTVSGCLFGLTGFFAVAGAYGRCYAGFSGGLGWSGITVALIAGNRPLMLFPVAFAYTAIEQGVHSAALATGLQTETSTLLQAAVLLAVTMKIPFIQAKARYTIRSQNISKHFSKK
ncbi:MAG: ABC transporter permease [Treponema sp.]|jgi:simple sugar transport system permease protein|nr:ABC transporter permease [Treponema sp.]